MTDLAATPALAPVADPRPLTTIPVGQLQVVGPPEAPAGHRILRAVGAFEICQFVLTDEAAQQVGKMLSAPSVIVTGVSDGPWNGIPPGVPHRRKAGRP